MQSLFCERDSVDTKYYKMQLKLLIIIFLLLFSIPAYGQFSQENISTDSTDIEITRNSMYRIYEETYKNKDSVWYSVRFVKDSTRLNTEGWMTKNKRRLGVWKEYNFDGQLMYTRDYDNGICEVNKSLYPYHDLLEQMKNRADSLIISTYSKEFFENHVRFDYSCYAYDEEGCVGTWIEPLERKPTEFLFRYDVKLNTSEWYDDMIGLDLDSNGEYIPNEGYWNNYGFEKTDTNYKTFLIVKDKAIEIAKEKGLNISDSSKISEFLKWEKYLTLNFYNGEFKYYIIELTKVIEDIREEGRSKIEYKYDIYSFNPWTGEFIEKKKMKRIKEWEKYSGFTSDLMPDE